MNMTQREFGETLGVSRVTVARWEFGFRISEKHKDVICQKFFVNRRWLEANETPVYTLDMGDKSPYEFARDSGCDEVKAAIFEMYCQLPPSKQLVISALLDYVDLYGPPKALKDERKITRFIRKHVRKQLKEMEKSSRQVKETNDCLPPSEGENVL